MANKDQIDTAVVIVNFNGGDHIIRCLAALDGQTFSPTEIIVVDNNSSDQSVTEIKTKFPQVTVIELEENFGFAAGNNKAFEAITSPAHNYWVALLNPDTIADKYWLESLVNAVHEHPNCEIFASQLMDASDNNRLDGTGDVYHVSGLSWRRHHGQIVSQPGLRDDPVFSPCAAAALYKLDALNAVGGFDESYFCYHEDIDLVFRMRSIGAQCRYIESSVVEHIGSGLTGKDSDFSVYHGHRNLVWTYFKNMPGWNVLWYLPQHLLLNIVTLTYYTLCGRGLIIWKSKWHAIKGLSQVLKQRKLIQKRRTVKPSQITDFMAKGLFRPYISRFR